MADPWERYRQLIHEEHIAHRASSAQQAKDRPFDPEVRAEAALLTERFRALAPRIAAGGTDEAVGQQARALLHDLEEMRDQRCIRGGSDWADLQRQCAELMMFIARMANGHGQPEPARDWFRRAAAAWQDLGQMAWVQECMLEAELASLAAGDGTDLVLETLDSWLSEPPPPVRRAKLLARTARILLDASDRAAARVRSDEAAQILVSAGFTDPVTAGSAERAFGDWVWADVDEPVPGPPGRQTQPLLSTVATIWELLTQMRLLLATAPRPVVLRGIDDIDSLRTRLLQEASAVGRQAESTVAAAPGTQPGWTSPVDSDAAADIPGRSYRQLNERHHRLAVLHDEAQHAVAGSAEFDALLSRIAELESEAVQAGDTLTASLAAVERANVLIAVNRLSEAALTLDNARGRLGDGDGLDTARRRALAVTIVRRAATVAGLQQLYPRLSQLCGEAIAEFEQDREQVKEPYRQDTYLRDRAQLYELGCFAAWKLGDHELALARADLAKAHGSLSWVVPGSAPLPAQIASLRNEFARLAGDPDLTRRQAVWDQLMTAQARARRADPPRLELAALQSVLAPDEAILYYFFVSRETLLSYVITPTAVGAERRILHGFRDKLDRLADDIGKLRGDMFWLDSDIPRLGSQLLPDETGPLLDDVRRLVICPHRILHDVPFHALDWAGAALIERFAVSYVPNVTGMLMSQPRSPSADVLSVGINSYAPLPDLPSAEREARDIAGLYRRAGVAATLLLDGEASLTHLEATSLERFRVIHFAAHGRDLPAADAYAAALYLSGGPVDAMNISQWALRADVVTMSACWSGRRPVYTRMIGSGAEREELFGDEIFGLQAAFFAAGARRVLGALWPLDDGSSSEVMKAFHRGLAAEQAPEFALQDAINEQRRAGRSCFHWAPYKLVSLGRPATTAKEG